MIMICTRVGGSAGRVYRVVWRGSAVTLISASEPAPASRGQHPVPPPVQWPPGHRAARTLVTIATHDARVPVLGEDELPLRLRVPGGAAAAPPQHTAHLPGSSGFRSEGSSLVLVMIISDKELVL